jgi:hypothetical protein
MPLSRRTFLAGAGASAAATRFSGSIARGAGAAGGNVGAAGAAGRDVGGGVARAPEVARDGGVDDAAGVAGAVPAAPTSPIGAEQAVRPAPLGDLFPTQAPEIVRELVTVAHFNAARVREMVTRQPSLARAAWDWGFGDWESALGAASHMGNREIAGILLAHGARPDLFSAAMLGQVEVVKALVAAAPGVERTLGPHGITLLAHAKAGKEAALPVVRFLAALGGADPALPLQPLAPEARSALSGRYRFGSGPRDVWIVETYQDGLSIQRAEAMARPLSHLGARVFSPAGAEAVRIRFSAERPAASFAVYDPDLIVTAWRS